MVESDPRRSIPRTDHLLALPEVIAAGERLNQATIKAIISEVQNAARAGEIPVAEVAPTIVSSLASRSASSLTPVLNATGILVHTNLGRAPLSPAATQAITEAAGYVDVEMDLGTGKRSKRDRSEGRPARPARRPRTPLSSTTEPPPCAGCHCTARPRQFRHRGLGEYRSCAEISIPTAEPGEIIISRGELIEIGAGFRLTDLMTTTGARLREVGTTNRTHLADYAEAINDDTSCLLKVHTSNFRVEGFTSSVEAAELCTLADEHELPLLVDLGSGLFTPDPALPDEPDIDTALRAGADLVIVSGDKLLGGPQAGLILGRTEAVQTLAKHPLARALRTDKLTLAALEATITHTANPIHDALHIDPDRLRERTETLAEAVGATIVEHDGRVGGGGAPGVPLPGWAVELPEACAAPLRRGDPAIVARVHQGRCLVDLRCVPDSEDNRIAIAIKRVRADNA